MSESTEEEAERETMDYDVVIVGVRIPCANYCIGRVFGTVHGNPIKG